MNINTSISNTHAGQKDPASFLEQIDDVTETQTAHSQNEDEINLDDALDDDNENPVSQTLIDAAENTGASEKDENEELEGEDEEADER